MASRIQVRRDTSANWQTNNPVLASGEAGLTTDAPRILKYGDGVTAWNSLPGISTDGAVYASAGHDHDAAYEAKVSRTGATAGEVPILQADSTLAFGAAGVTDHGGLTGLADDDHPQYVKDSGDTMTGPLLLPDGTAAAPSVAFTNHATDGFWHPNALEEVALSLGGMRQYTWMPTGFLPAVNGGLDLGSATLKWRDIHATNGTIQTSDVNEKADLRPIDPTDALARVRRLAAEGVLTFRWPDGTRRHAGFSAQKVAEVHGDETAAFIDPAVEADDRTNPYAAAEPTAEFYDDHVTATPPDPADYDDPDELAEAQADYDADVAEQRADAEAEWAEARDEFDAETEAMRTAPKGLRPAELLPDLYAAIAEQQRQIEALAARVADLEAA